MRSRNIKYDENDAGDIAIISEIISHDVKDIHNILLSIVDKFKDSVVSNKIDINRFLEYIHQHYSENETLEKIAIQFGTSAPHLSRMIKKETTLTFTEYVNTLRIDKAKELLQISDMSISEIYEQLGFNNRNTFIRIFKSMVGVTPSEYRKSLKTPEK